MSRRPSDKPPDVPKHLSRLRPSRPVIEDHVPDSAETLVRPSPDDDERTRIANAPAPAGVKREPPPQADPSTRGFDSPNETVMMQPRQSAPGPHTPGGGFPAPTGPHQHLQPSTPPPAAPTGPHQHLQPLPTGPHQVQPLPAARRSAHDFPPTPAGWQQPLQQPMRSEAPPGWPQPHPSSPVVSDPLAPTGPRAIVVQPRTGPLPQDDDDAPPSSSRGGPGSFSRIFLGNVEKYREKGGNIGSASQEAAAVLAQTDAPEERRAKGSALRLRSRLALVEALGLTLLLPLIGWLAHRDDPFFLNHHFSWIVVAPLLLGLRHGFAPALASAVVLDGMIAAAWRTQLFPIDKLPGETMVGIAALAMITGQFSDVWKRELVRLDGGFEGLRKQLGEVMRAHFLLELSHDRIEERMGKGTPNLRDALVAVNRAVSVGPVPSLSAVSEAVVDIFSTYTMVEVGGLYRVDEGGRVVAEPIAKIGRPAPLDLADEQVKEALATKKLTYIRGGAGVETRTSRTNLLAVVPFVDSWQKLHGFLAIESIPLLAFERRNLEALALLGGRFADAIATGGKDTGVQRGQKKELEIRLRRSIRDLVENDVPSTLFVLLVRKGGAASDSIETILGGTLRALDFPYVERDAQGNHIVFILLPLTDEAGARSFGTRVERIVRREGNMPLARAGAFSFYHVIRPDDKVEEVMRKLEARTKLDEASIEHTIVV